MIRFLCLVAGLICALVVTFGGNGGRINLHAAALALLIASFLAPA